MNYFLFGNPIQHSISPLIHNTGFSILNTNNKYELFETSDIQSVIKTLTHPQTAGGSITIPHKETILPFLERLSKEAHSIGAVNTVIKKEHQLIGYNTDWIGIKKPIEATKKKFASALIIGAGGAARSVCYALNQLEIPFSIYNRTSTKATKLAQEFNGKVCKDLCYHQSELVINTVPPTAIFDKSEAFWKTITTVFDIVYVPYFTPLLAEAKNRNIQTIHGVEMLLEQAYEQFFLWTDTIAPKQIIQAVVHETLGINTTQSTT
jgi:shikimate dehydrogenase